MRIYFAGAESDNYRNILLKGGIKNRLESFWALGMGKSKPANNMFESYLLDSGGYSARIRGVKINVKDYADYLNKYKVRLAFNLDTNDVEETLANQAYLEKNAQAYIIPIYHLSDWLSPKYRSLIKEYSDNYPYIGLGGSAGGKVGNDARKKFLNYSFSFTKDKTRVHGLGMTGEWMLMTYPYYSVDSTSWLSMGRFANSKIHSKEMAKVVARKRHHTENATTELEYWRDLQARVDKLWEKRGVKWEPFEGPEY